MRILVISDIHGNINALRTVITDAGKVDTIWCLGDIVGYGPDPNECVDLLRELPELVCLLGNHDAAVANPAEVATFNPEARISIEWTIDQLRPDNFEYLSRLPNRVILDEVTLVHGSPRSPTYEYLLDTYMATINFAYFKTSFCFVGHTHLPVQFSMGNGLGYAELLIPKERDTMQMVHRSILNPGSVGQPRDRDPRASYAIYEPEEQRWEYRRVAYNYKSVQTRMENYGLPERHIQRLALGW